MPNGQTLFANQFQKQNDKYVWAGDYAKSAEYAYRKLWNIPRHDPRLEKMTPEEFEFELIVDMQLTRMMKGLPVLEETEGNWKESAQKKLQRIMDDEVTQAKAEQGEMESVDPEEVFGIGSGNKD